MAYTLLKFMDLSIVLKNVHKNVAKVTFEQRKIFILYSDQSFRFTNIIY